MYIEKGASRIALITKKLVFKIPKFPIIRSLRSLIKLWNFYKPETPWIKKVKFRLFGFKFNLLRGLRKNWHESVSWFSTYHTYLFFSCKYIHERK